MQERRRRQSSVRGVVGGSSGMSTLLTVTVGSSAGVLGKAADRDHAYPTTEARGLRAGVLRRHAGTLRRAARRLRRGDGLRGRRTRDRGDLGGRRLRDRRRAINRAPGRPRRGACRASTDGRRPFRRPEARSSDPRGRRADGSQVVRQILITQADRLEVYGPALRAETREGDPDRGQRNREVVQLPENRDDARHEIDRRREVAGGPHDGRAPCLGQQRVLGESPRQAQVGGHAPHHDADAFARKGILGHAWIVAGRMRRRR